MTIAEFEKNYSLHDSSLTKVEFGTATKILTLTIEIGFEVIAVTFENVSLFEYEQHEYGNVLENLDTEIDRIEVGENELLEIFIFEYQTLGEDKFWWLKIKAENVSVTHAVKFL